MSLLALRRPLWASLLHDPWLNYCGPSRIFDQYLGETIDDDELDHLASLLPSTWLGGSLRASADSVRRRAGSEHGTSQVEYGDKEFRVNLDIRQFGPEEVSVKVVENRVVVHAKHEEREDQHGLIKREFTRSYVLPKDVDASKLEARVNADGTLRIAAPRVQPEKPKETVIPIRYDDTASSASAPAMKATTSGAASSNAASSSQQS